MTRRSTTLTILAALVGTLAAPLPALADWNGLKAFNCVTSNANWHFDGLYGRDTTLAVRSFQRAKNLPVTGVADAATAKALGVPYKRDLKCGTGGNDVLVLQRGLAAAGFWYGQAGPTKPMAMPTMKPTPAPTPMPTMRPTPMPTMRPTPEPTMRPTPRPMASTEALKPMVDNEPTLDIRGGTWLIPTLGFWYVPVGGSQFNYDFSSIRNNYWVNGDLWAGNWGVGGEFVAFNLANPTFSGPLFTNGLYMYDGQVSYRWDEGFWKAFAGYRGLNTAGNLNFGKAGLMYEHPVCDWLWYNAKLQGGYGTGSSYFADGQLGLDAHFGNLGAGIAFRNLYMSVNGAAPTTINGPTANLELKF
jgi:hypothetical protein